MIRKYFITILSFLLILSNFSYAANLMMCGMVDEGNVKPCCIRNSDNDLSGPAVSKVKNPCCDFQTIELSNSNNLLNVKNDLSRFDLKFIGLLDQNLSPYKSLNVINNFLFIHSSSYKLFSDIPILTSSLLI